MQCSGDGIEADSWSFCLLLNCFILHLVEQSDRACLDVEVRAGQGHMAQSGEGEEREGEGPPDMCHSKTLLPLQTCILTTSNVNMHLFIYSSKNVFVHQCSAVRHDGKITMIAITNRMGKGTDKLCKSNCFDLSKSHDVESLAANYTLQEANCVTFHSWSRQLVYTVISAISAILSMSAF